MRKFKFTKLLLVGWLALLPLATTARANHPPFNGAAANPARLTAAPIGTVESFSAFEINGTATRQRGLLWNGDIVQAAPGTSAQVSLSSLGQLTLRGGSAVKLVADAEAHTLTAAMLNGEMQVTLNADTAAKLELAGASFVTTKGARFRAGVREGEPVLVTTAGRALTIGNFGLQLSPETGTLAQAQAGPRRYLIKPLNLGTNTEIRARSSRNIQVRVTDENDRPVPDAPVLFLLGSGGSGGAGGSGAGTLGGQQSLRATTNSQGVAEVNFNASSIVGSTTTIQVTVEGSNAVWQGTITIIRAAAGFWAPQNAVPIFSVVGAAIGVGAYKYATRDPVRQTPQIEPRQGGSVIVP
jgi:hypothetical protein